MDYRCHSIELKRSRLFDFVMTVYKGQGALQVTGIKLNVPIFIHGKYIVFVCNTKTSTHVCFRFIFQKNIIPFLIFNTNRLPLVYCLFDNLLL